MAETYEAVIDEAYPKAKTMGHQYGFMLMRVIGVSYFEGDPLIVLYDHLKNSSATQEEIDSCLDFWTYLVNLSLVSQGGQYNPYPIIASSSTTDYYSLGAPLLDTNMKSALDEARNNGKFLDFSKYLIESYGVALKGFFTVHNPLVMRDPYFTTTEFYMNADGVVGLTAHHSNGTSSTFFRSSKDTQAVNVVFENSVGFFMGNMTNLRREWLINGEPAYKSKPKGKYNEDGEWKPIVYYNGDSSIPQNAALDFSEDEQVQGVFFYMYTTGFPVVEFVLRTKIDLPEQLTVFDSGVNLYKVDNDKSEMRNEYVYDGWLRFEDLTEQGIQRAIDSIRIVVQGLTFAFEAETTWRLKYSLHTHARGASTATKEDMEKTISLLKSIDISDDRDSLMAAISWFNLGTKSDDPIVAFVCYYTAVEALARQLSEGKLKASKFYKTKKAALSNEEKLAKYDELYKELYPSKLTDLMRDGYFDIHITLTQAMKNAFESVYGEEHSVYETMFGKNGLVSLRGSIVHESYSEWDRKHYDQALRHLHEIRTIANGFIIRLATHIPKGQGREAMSGRFKLSMDAGAPTTMLVGSDLKYLPNDDWKIRHEWI